MCVRVWCKSACAAAVARTVLPFVGKVAGCTCRMALVRVSVLSPCELSAMEIFVGLKQMDGLQCFAGREV